MAKQSSVVGDVVYLEDEITEVKMGPIEGNAETFTFKLRGIPFKAAQTGRLRDLCIGHSETADRRITVMAIADGLAVATVAMARDSGKELNPSYPVYYSGSADKNGQISIYMQREFADLNGVFVERVHVNELSGRLASLRASVS